MQSINLIPQQEVQQQSEAKAVTLSTWLSIVVLLIVGAITGFVIFRSNSIRGQIKSIESEITGLRTQIASMSEVEINARNLDKKYTTLRTIFNDRLAYSALTAEVAKRTPAGVTMDSMTLQKGNKLNITGHADNYILIAAFTNNLTNAEFQGGDASLKKLFTSVVLNSVSLEKTRNIVRFSINADLNGELLKKK